MKAYIATGIDSLTSDDATVNCGPVYTLQGMRVADRLAGVYVVRGKKIVVR